MNDNSPITSLLSDMVSAPSILASLTSYADALTAAIRRASKQNFEIDGLRFIPRGDIVIPTDYVSTGRHTLVYELEGTGKQYRVMIEPVWETHGKVRS